MLSVKSKKVFVACAFGAGIGGLVALQLSATLCFLGVLLGGLTGYLSYEWKTVITAIPRAYCATTSYRFPPHYWRTVGWFGVYTASGMSWIFIVLGIMLCFSITFPNNPKYTFYEQAYWAGLFGTAGFLVAVLSATLVIGVIFLGGFAGETGEDVTEKYAETVTGLKRDALEYFPPFVFWQLAVLCVKKAPAFLWVCAMAPVIALLFIKRFCWNLFLLIHSEERLICGCDSMLGACAGWAFGSVIIGMLVGGILGVLNYELVTERWLRPRGLVPVKK